MNEEETDKFAETFSKVLEEHGAMIVDKKRLKEGIKKAYETGFDAGYSAAASFRWWKISSWW